MLNCYSIHNDTIIINLDFNNGINIKAEDNNPMQKTNI